MKRFFLCLAILPPVLMLQACSVNFPLIEKIVVDTASALPIFAAADPSLIAPIFITYVGDVAGCVANSGPVAPSQFLTIGACLASEIAPTLAPGTPQEVVSILASIANDVKAFVVAYPPKALGGSKVPKQFTTQQAATLTRLRMRALQTVSQARNWPHQKT